MGTRDCPNGAEDEKDPQRESGRCAGDIHCRFQEEGEDADRSFRGESRGTLQVPPCVPLGQSLWASES